MRPSAPIARWLFITVAHGALHIGVKQNSSYSVVDNMEPAHGYSSGCFIPFVILTIVLGVLRWRYGWGWGWGYSPWWWLFGGGSGSSWSSGDYVVTDDWVPAQQRWKDEDEEGKPRVPLPVALPPLQAERGFRDERLETLINEGKLREAREYLRGMIAIAMEMNDKQCEANYERYEQEIELASMGGQRLAHTETDNGGRTDNDKLINL